MKPAQQLVRTQAVRKSVTSYCRNACTLVHTAAGIVTWLSMVLPFSYACIFAGVLRRVAIAEQAG